MQGGGVGLSDSLLMHVDAAIKHANMIKAHLDLRPTIEDFV